MSSLPAEKSELQSTITAANKQYVIMTNLNTYTLRPALLFHLFSLSHSRSELDSSFLILPYPNTHLLNHCSRFMSLHLLIICHSFIPFLSSLFNRIQIPPASIRPSEPHSFCTSLLFPQILPSIFSSTELISLHPPIPLTIISATPPKLVHAGFKYKTNTLKLKQQILIYLIANFQNAGVDPPPSTLTECCCHHLLGKTMQSSTCLFASAGFNQASFIHYSSSQNMHRSILTISVYLSWVNQLPYKTTNSYVFLTDFVS